MRSRTVREGSVGLLILLGLSLFVGLILWVRGFTIGRNNYKIIVEFANTVGMQQGTVVRYRGVNAGKISDIRAGVNGVEVEIEITPDDLIIPRDVVVEVNQSSLIGETTIDIMPRTLLPEGSVAAKPLDKNCDRTLIVCNNSRLSGQIGVSIDQLIRVSTKLFNLYNNPTLFANLNAAAKNSSDAAQGVTQLTRDLSGLSKVTQQQLGNFSSAANSVERAANNISATTNKAANNLSVSANKTVNQLSTTANQFGQTAEQIRLTTIQANRLINNLDALVTSNRSSLVTALDNINQTSNQLRLTVGGLTPTLNRFNQGQLIQNLETLSANAAQASANLRDVSNALNDPNNLVQLQVTLDSARETFENARKITADLDDLTGDDTFRENLRQLVNGLSGLVSSTEQLEQQAELAQTLHSVTIARKAEIGSLKVNNHAISISPTEEAAAVFAAIESLKPLTISKKSVSKEIFPFQNVPTVKQQDE